MAGVNLKKERNQKRGCRFLLWWSFWSDETAEQEQERWLIYDGRLLREAEEQTGRSALVNGINSCGFSKF